jgi:hypothetical protein
MYSFNASLLVLFCLLSPVETCAFDLLFHKEQGVELHHPIRHGTITPE